MAGRNEEISFWNGLRNGSEDHLHSLYVHCYNDLLRYGLTLTNDPELAKEFINEVFLDFWKNRLKLPEVENPKAYIITSYKNRIIFRKRKAGDLITVGFEDHPDLTEPSSSVEQTLIELQEFKDKRDQISNLLLMLTERQRQLIVLRFIEERSYEEIANLLNISTRTVYNSIHESLKLLRLQRL